MESAIRAKLQIGVIGVGLVGSAHIEAISRTGLAEVVAVAASSSQSAQRTAERYGVGRAHSDWREVVQDPDVDVVHNCTPNHLHAAVGQAALAAGKHLISEKPIAASLEDAAALVDAAEATELVSALCQNYRHYPMVAHARELVRGGAIGDVFQIHGVYLQDWLCGSDVSNWRLDPDQGGASITFADIGTHWCDLASHLSGRRIESVCATTGGRHGRRGDDHAGALLGFEGGALGTLVASQVSPGTKNGLRIQLDGSEGSLFWDQERPEVLWLGRASGPSELHPKSIDELEGPARPLAHLPAGHPEGWNTTFVNLFESVYRRILGPGASEPNYVATLADGLALLRLVEAVGRSNRSREWVDVDAIQVVAR